MFKKLNGKSQMKKNILLAIVSFTLTIFIAEMTARFCLGRFCGLSFQYYLTYDGTLGWKPRPKYWCKIQSVAKEFDFEVQITSSSYRSDDGFDSSFDNPAIVIIGDSQAFGFGLDRNETLAAQITRKMFEHGEKVSVLNAGVPGYDLLQRLLRLKNIDLVPGTDVLCLVHPVNDAVNTANDVDYGVWKPFLTFKNHQMQLVHPLRTPPGIYYHFSPDFSHLNSVFGLRNPNSNKRRWLTDRSALLFLAFYSRSLVPFRRPATAEELIWDDINPAQYPEMLLQKLRDNPTYTRVWPEITEFARDRAVLMEHIKYVFDMMNRYVKERNCRLVVIIAPEADRLQKFARKKTDLLVSISPQYDFSWGSTRAEYIRVLRDLSVDYLTPSFQPPFEEMFLNYDVHISAKGFNNIANEICRWIVSQNATGDVNEPKEVKQNQFTGGKVNYNNGL